MEVVTHLQAAPSAGPLAVVGGGDRPDLERRAEPDRPDRSARSVPCDRAKWFPFARSALPWQALVSSGAG